MQKVSYMGNGETTEFTFNFPYFENTDVVVTKNGATATGYNIIGNSAGLDADIPYVGGTVVFETAPSALDNITIARSLPLARQYDYQPTVQIDPTTLNQDMNYLMEVVKDLQDEIDALHTQYSEIADKESTATLLSRIDTVSEEISDFQEELDNNDFMYKEDFNLRVTNCVTEIPQNIKLELDSGTLTLKSGSLVYLPNGAGVFDTLTTESDLTVTISNDDSYMVFVNTSGPSLGYRRLSAQTASGTSTPTTGYWGYYNTTDNKIYVINNGVKSGQFSLPLAIITVSGGAITNIDQVFNGLGYIGSQVFVLPGVRALIPNGRNSDGTLKNIDYTMQSVVVYARNLTGTKIPVYLFSDGTLGISSGVSYNSERNIIGSGGCCQIGAVTMSSGTVSALYSKYALHIADYYDL